MLAALAPLTELDEVEDSIVEDPIKESVLVVEDDVLLGDLLVMLLEAEGYSATVAHDGQEALKLASELHPSLITLDLQLPVLNGQMVLKRLAATEPTRRIPIVVFSSDVASLQPTRQVKRVLLKPDGIDDLVDAVRTALGEAS